MKRTVWAAVALCLVAGSAVLAARPPARPPAKPAQPAREPTRPELLTQHIAGAEAKLRTEKDPDLRKRLTEDIETAKHELGPTDAAGNRIKCQAMWHDAALRDLDADIKRLTLRAKPKGGAGLALDARLAARRMASIGLTRGWSYGATMPKYQFDALGTYLVNNMPALDRLFDEAAAALAESPEPTAQELADLKNVNAVIASLTGEGWEPVKAAMEKFAAVTESGLRVPSARPAAQQLLDTLNRLANYIKGLTASKVAYPEYVAKRQESIAETLEYLAKPSYRRQQYSQIRLMCEGDQDRRALERGPLSPEASQGLLMASGTPSAAFKGAKDAYLADRFRASLATVIRVLGKMPDWPPKDMTGQLKPLYGRCAEVFGRAAEALGKAPQDDLEAFEKAASETAVYAGDIERLFRADEAIKAVARYVPAQAPPMYARLVSAAEGLVRNTSIEKRKERQELDLYFGPFQKLAGLRLPGPEHARAATTVSGGAYKPAVTFLAGNVTRNLVSAAQGNSTWLDTTLDVQPLFSALRHRAVAETAGLPKVGTANLHPFSAPEKPWSQFIASLDGNIRLLLKQYGSEHKREIAWDTLRPWDGVYCALAAAQQLTRNARQPGESETDFLMRHLAQAADPNPPDAVWFGWAVGYHGTEAAACLAAGYERTAGWHLGVLGEIRQEQRLGSVLGWRDFDPPEE